MIRDVLFGIAVGDALGIPMEFKLRADFENNPVTEMTGYGTHQQPAGTFSDDSSMAFCQAEALIGEYNLNKLAKLFIAWKTEGY